MSYTTRLVVIRAVAWVAHAEAIDRLATIGWHGMRDPMLAYLRGDAPAGTIWHYRME